LFFRLNVAVVDSEADLRHYLYPVAAVYLWAVSHPAYVVVAVAAVVSLFSAACIPAFYHAAVCIFQAAPAIENPVGAGHPWVEPE
jgi:hypothetical protein